jgi:hypothetical protein
MMLRFVENWEFVLGMLVGEAIVLVSSWSSYKYWGRRDGRKR